MGWARFESGDLYNRTTLPLRRSTAATLYSSAMTDANDTFTVAERYRPTAINNVRSKSITAGRCCLFQLTVRSHGSVCISRASSFLSRRRAALYRHQTWHVDRACPYHFWAHFDFLCRTSSFGARGLQNFFWGENYPSQFYAYKFVIYEPNCTKF